MEKQKKTQLIIEKFVNPEEWPSLRGIIAHWESDVLTITYFFNGEITEELRENASILATEVLAQFFEGSLKENYISIKPSQPLPDSQFWTYINPTSMG